MVTTKDPEWTSFLHWTPRGTGALVPAVAACAHLPPQGVHTNLGKSLLVLNLLYWLKFRVLFVSGAGYLPPPSRKDTGVGGQVKHPGHTHTWSRH